MIKLEAWWQSTTSSLSFLNEKSQERNIQFSLFESCADSLILIIHSHVGFPVAWEENTEATVNSVKCLRAYTIKPSKSQNPTALSPKTFTNQKIPRDPSMQLWLDFGLNSVHAPQVPVIFYSVQDAHRCL